LIAAARRDPVGGIGEPERLKHAPAGLWSRRSDDVHRLVRHVADDALIVHQARHHYGAWTAARLTQSFTDPARPDRRMEQGLHLPSAAAA